MDILGLFFSFIFFFFAAKPQKLPPFFLPQSGNDKKQTPQNCGAV